VYPRTTIELLTGAGRGEKQVKGGVTQAVVQLLSEMDVPGKPSEGSNPRALAIDCAARMKPSRKPRVTSDE
jgi:hypothetical protein